MAISEPRHAAMDTDTIHLKILLPSQVFADRTGVTRMVVETSAGAHGILPHRLDCAAVLEPGILM